MKTKIKYLNAFTLIELLISITVIIVLVGFITKATFNSKEKAKILRTHNLLKKIQGAITSFEADWGEIPPTTSHLISPALVKTFATEKNVTLISYNRYLDNVPEMSGFKFLYIKNCCPEYHPDYNTNHAPGIKALSYQDYLSHIPKIGNCKKCGKAYTKNAFMIKAHEDETMIESARIIADIFGSPVYYLRNIEQGTYILISPGPDKEISLDITKWGQYLNNELSSFSYDIKSSDSKDKDNIYLSYNY